MCLAISKLLLMQSNALERSVKTAPVFPTLYRNSRHFPITNSIQYCTLNPLPNPHLNLNSVSK